MKKKDEKKINIEVRNYNGTLNKLKNIQILLGKESSLKSLCKLEIKYNNYINNSS